MSNYDDFDLDLRQNNEESARAGVTDFTPDIMKSIIHCTQKISEWVGCTDGKECAMPTKDRPAASCHKNMAEAIQRRC